MPSMIEKETVIDGLQTVVLVPSVYLDPREGIPITPDIRSLFPAPWGQQIQDALWARGLRRPRDFADPRNHKLILQAIQSTIRADVHRIVSAVKES